MTNAFYVKGAEKILSGAINLSADTIKAMLVKNTYPQNLTTDEFLSGVSAYRVGTDQALAGKSVAGGKFDANDPTWAAVAAGDTVEAIVIYKDTGVAGTSPLIAYIDQVTGFPWATNGGDVAPTWDNGTAKIVSLV